jgi:protein-S-isoprenylcysteine O-methyltransferase Ste14
VLDDVNVRNFSAMRTTGIILYFLGLAFSEALRLPRRYTHLRSPNDWHTGKGVSRLLEFCVLCGIVVGLWVLPGIYAFTPLLDSHNYSVPHSTIWMAAVLFLFGLVIRWMAHRTLGRLWTGTLEINQDHKLLTDGIYTYLRHPLYASLILWALCQPILLPNVVAGWSGLVAVGVLWVVRVPKEEAMLQEQFGEEYERYAARTGRIFPALRSKTGLQ